MEWAHHWLGKEYDANPVAFNHIKLGHYMMGESDIILNCSKPEEIRARLCLMRKMGYWVTKYEWSSVRNVYAAILRAIETGRESWEIDFKEYEDILVTQPRNTARVGHSTSGERGQCPRDVYFCGPYQ